MMRLKTLKIMLLICLIVTNFVLLTGCADENKSKVKNFVLIYTDELDFSDIEVYGGKYPTPNINKLSEDGITFTNAYTTSPVCNPSRFSVLTGQYPGRSKSESFLRRNPLDAPYILTQNATLSETTITLPKILEQSGFVTGMSGKWHLGGTERRKWFDGIKPTDSMLDKEVANRFADYRVVLEETVKKLAGFSVAENIYPGNTDVLPLEELRFHNFGWVTKGGIEFLDQQKNSETPFFLYLTPTAIHGPHHYESLKFNHDITLGGVDKTLELYRPNHDSLRAMCKNISPQQAHRLVGISNIDYQVKLIVEKLKELGIYNETAIIFMADHGIEPGKATALDRGMKVPLIVKIPGNKMRGTKSDVLVQNIDWLPTILEYAGIEKPKNHRLDGISLYNLLENGEIPSREYIYTETGLTRSVTDGKYKYISFRYPKTTLDKMKTGEIDYAPNQWNMFRQPHSAIAIKFHPDYFDTDQLYDLEKDPYEMKNLAYDANYSSLVEKYKNATKNITDTFKHPYEYYDDEFLRSDKYLKLVEKTRSLGVDWIEWWKRDHDFDYPPK